VKILLFDAFSVLNRAFYAIPLLTNKEGEYTNAVYGFMNIFLRFLDEEKPDYITVAWDLPQPTFRHEAYGAYKANRKGMPDELRAQVPTLKALLEKMQINMAECPGYEADDVIGTLTAQAVAQGISPVIISGDRDLLQLATDKVKIRLPKTKAGKTEVEDYHAADVLAKYGVSPQAFIDVKALMGDPSDNVPGVPGIGEVTATKIISAYGSLENAFENIGEIKPKKAAENLAEFKEQAILSQMLVTIAQDAPVQLQLTPPSQMWNAQAQEEVKRLGLTSFYKRFEAKETAPARELVYEVVQDYDDAKKFFAALGAASTAARDSNSTAPVLPTAEEAPALSSPPNHTALQLLWDDAALVGIAIADGHKTTYVATDSGELSLFSVPGITSEQLLTLAKPWLESPTPKCIYDAKSDARRLHGYGIILNFCQVLDIMLSAYILDALSPNKTPSDIALKYLGETLPTIDDLLDNKGKRGKDRRNTRDIPVEAAAKFAAVTADALLRIHPIIQEQLQANNQMQLYQNMELPMAKALLDMELAGIKVDPCILTEYGKPLTQRINELTAEIHQLAGEEFNINSPAQVGVVLFEKLKLHGGKKTTQGYSTAAGVLEKLADKHPIVPLILEYRAHAKLRSTYVEGLLPLIDPATSRIHTTFHQCLTATGRLSSAEPNLQNIPVRMPLGRELRKAFVPREGCVFVDADYSQIELRLLAHMSGDHVLINAFKENLDIHRLTASQVLGIAPEDVTAEQRGRAKAVNFGIIYGMGAFGLSEDLKISVREAELYIAGYFAKYPGVKIFMDKIIEDAKETGYVATLYNRRRPMPELRSSNFNIRAAGERIAMNMPLQGTAADIIKLAMINVSRRLQEEGLTARLVLQVHDELLLEVPHNEVASVTSHLKNEMENVASLSVPLVADVNVGDSWYETK